MFEQIEKLKEKVRSYKAATEAELEAFRMEFVSRKSVLGELFDAFKDVPSAQKKDYGVALNQLKGLVEERFKELAANLSESGSATHASSHDLTLPAVTEPSGGIHPLTALRARIIEIFERIGFSVADGPEIETDWYNFTALNFPENHPAREMQDTFFIEKNPDVLLRTHTSSVQVRLMESGKPPFRAIMPGRVFRNEAITARAHCIFHQVEGLYIDEGVGFADLKQTLYHFAKEMFHKDIKIRFRPSYFPFTEPSAEIDISCLICNGKGCNICKYTGWVEIAGSGMVDPNVLENCGIDSDKYTGFAFGMGIERMALLKYQVRDLRLFTENDVRFLKQFSSIL